MGDRYLFTTRVGNDAVGAAFIASDGNVDHCLQRSIAVFAKRIGALIIVDVHFHRMGTVEYLIDPGNVAGTKDEIDRRSPTDHFVTEMAGGTTAHPDFGTFFAMLVEDTDFGKEFGDRLFPDGAGVDQDQICFIQMIRQFIRIFTIKLSNHMLTVTLIHRATKRFDEEFFGGYFRHEDSEERASAL